VKHSPLATALICLATLACAADPPPSAIGEWRSVEVTGDGAPRSDLINQQAVLSRDTVHWMDLRCAKPVISSVRQTRAEFTADFRVDPTRLGVTGDVIDQTVVRCPLRARHERTLIWLSPTRVVTAWESWYVLFERVGE
jgi:hypothetical protein